MMFEHHTCLQTKTCIPDFMKGACKFYAFFKAPTYFNHNLVKGTDLNKDAIIINLEFLQKVQTPANAICIRFVQMHQYKPCFNQSNTFHTLY